MRIQLDLVPSWQSLRECVQNRLRGPSCKQKTQSPAQRGDQETFGKKLTDDARPIRAQGGANSEFPRSGRRPGEQQTSYICGRDQQHETHSTKQQQQDRADIANDGFLQRNKRDAYAFIGFGICRFQIPCNCVHIGLRLPQLHTRLKPADYTHAHTHAAVMKPGVIPRSDRNKDVRRFVKRGSSRHYTDDRVRFAVHG